MLKFFSLRSFRPPDQQPDRRACNWMLVSAALAVGLHVAHLPVWLTAFAACLLCWRYFIENHAWRIPGRLVRWSLLLLTAVLVFRHYGTLVGRDAGVAYLALLVGLKILEIRSLRDYLLAVFLIYLLVLGAVLFSQSLATGAYGFLAIFVSTHALVLLNRPQSLSQAQSLRLVGIVMLQALPVLLVLYLLFPRIQGSLWGLPQDAFAASTGLSEEVSPGAVNRLYNDDTIAFRAEFDGSPPPPADLYWRTFVLSDTDGRTWRRHHGGGDGPNHWRYQALDAPLRYSITLEPHNQRWIPALDLPVLGIERTRPVPGFVLQSVYRVRSPRRYPLTSHRAYRTGPLSPLEASHNTVWPDRLSPRVAELLERWRRSAGTPQEQIQLALDFFAREGFRYTLSPPLLTGDTLDDFLFRTRAGYCEHFASAFVALMRLSNIPARLVAGYQGGDWNPDAGYMIVRQSDAHAWAEVWLAPRGWVRVDPTAAVAPERVELGADALRQLAARGAGIGQLPVEQARLLIQPSWARSLRRQLSWRWDALNTAWDNWVMAYGPAAQRELLELLGMQTPRWANMIAVMALGVVLVLAVTAAVWRFTRKNEDPVVAAYRRYCAKLDRFGYPRRPAEGPVDYARRLLEARPDLAAPVNRITRLYVALRYGRAAPAGVALLRKHVASFRVKPPRRGRAPNPRSPVPG